MQEHTIPNEVIQRIKDAVGPKGWTTDAGEMAPKLLDRRGRFHGAAPILVRPGNTQEVAVVLGICHQAAVGVVPQGGNTGLVGGSVPREDGGEILLCLERMNRIRALDPANLTMTVDAGCILADVQTAADDADLLFPLSLAAEGSCQIGGNLATNAGGTAVLRYGNARDLVLGLEVVLADGSVWDGLRGLRKDNTGYDLKHLFMGAEGTLGIITGAVLRLFPRPSQVETAFAAVADPAAAVDLLGALRGAAGDAVVACEYMDRTSLDMVWRHIPGTRDPFDAPYAHYLLLELAASGKATDLQTVLEEVLQSGAEGGLLRDAVLARSEAQRNDFWRMRETIPEAERADGAGIKHDISVPVSRISELIERGSQAILTEMPEAILVCFGHLGDGNMHFNLNQPASMSEEAFFAKEDAIHRAVYDIVQELEGSFSAEHGVGRLRRDEMERYRSAVELDLMRALKQAIDPKGILNPGKVV